MSARAWVAIIVVALVIIAGSLTFMRTSGSPPPRTYADIGTELGGGRVERTADGFAVTVPPGWQAWAPSIGFQDWWGADGEMHLWLEPVSTAETWWMSTCAFGQECSRERMAQAGGEAYCWVVDDSAIATEDGWADPAARATLTATGLVEVEGWTDISTETYQLAGGSGAVVRASDPNGWRQELHQVSDGQRWLRLICGVLDSDVDPRAIAQSVEFLPLPG